MTDAPYRPEGGRHHVVVIGSGFGGLFAVQNLKKNANVDITLIDRTLSANLRPLYEIFLRWDSSPIMSAPIHSLVRRTNF